MKSKLIKVLPVLVLGMTVNAANAGWMQRAARDTECTTPLRQARRSAEVYQQKLDQWRTRWQNMDGGPQSILAYEAAIRLINARENALQVAQRYSSQENLADLPTMEQIRAMSIEERMDLSAVPNDLRDAFQAVDNEIEAAMQARQGSRTAVSGRVCGTIGNTRAALADARSVFNSLNSREQELQRRIVEAERADAQAEAIEAQQEVRRLQERLTQVEATLQESAQMAQSAQENSAEAQRAREEAENQRQEMQISLEEAQQNAANAENQSQEAQTELEAARQAAEQARVTAEQAEQARIAAEQEAREAQARYEEAQRLAGNGNTGVIINIIEGMPVEGLEGSEEVVEETEAEENGLNGDMTIAVYDERGEEEVMSINNIIEEVRFAARPENHCTLVASNSFSALLDNEVFAQQVRMFEELTNQPANIRAINYAGGRSGLSLEVGAIGSQHMALNASIEDEDGCFSFDPEQVIINLGNYNAELMTERLNGDMAEHSSEGMVEEAQDETTVQTDREVAGVTSEEVAEETVEEAPVVEVQEVSAE